MRNLTNTDSSTKQKSLLVSFIALISSFFQSLMSVFNTDDKKAPVYTRETDPDQTFAERPKVAHVAVIVTIDPPEEVDEVEVFVESKVRLTCEGVIPSFADTIELKFPNIPISYTFPPPPDVVDPDPITKTTRVVYIDDQEDFAAIANQTKTNVWVNGILDPENTDVDFLYKKKQL